MNLNTEQIEAATSEARSLRVIAPPGSGKTALLVERIRHLVTKCGFSPLEVMAVTFTRKAALELQARVEAAMPGKRVKATTIHSWSYSIIDRFAEILGIGRPVCVLDEDDVEFIAKSLIEERGLKITSKRARELVSAVVCRSLDEMRFIEYFRAILKTNNALLYDDLLRCALVILRNPRALEIVRSRARAIVWDEFQDSSMEELEIADRLSPDSLTIVGDPEQAIYEWRGACPQAFLDIEKHLPRDEGWQTVRLVKNYRSCPEIIAAYKPLSKIHENMEAVRTDRGSYTRMTSLDSSLLGFVTNRAFLARTNHEAEGIYQHLLGAGADVAILGKRTDPWRGREAASWVRVVKAHLSPRGSIWRRYVSTEEAARVEALDSQDTAKDDRGSVLLSTVVALIGSPGESLLDGFSTVSEWYGWYVTKRAQDLLTSEAAIQVLTMHSAKGLEWDDVIVVEPMYPKKTDEERRLMFVAMSRARNKLFIYTKGVGK